MVLIFISPDCNYRGDAMSITNKLNQIKNAIYGKEVRGAIHDAIKQVYDDASVNHDNANMEVKMARGTHNTLNDRLDKSEQKLDETNAQLSRNSKKWISVLDFGAVGDGITSDSQAIQNAINSGNNIIFPEGKTYLCKNIKLSSDKTLYMYGATLKCGGNSPADKDSIENQPGIFYGYGTSNNYTKNITILGGSLIGLRQQNDWNVQTSDLGDDIIQFSFIDGLTIRDCIISEAGQDGLEIKTCKNVLIQGNKFKNIADAALEIRGTGSYIVKDNYFYMTRNALFMKGHEEFGREIPKNVVFENNFCQTHFSPIIFHYSENIIIRNNKLYAIATPDGTVAASNVAAINTASPPTEGATNDIKNIVVEGNEIVGFTDGMGIQVVLQKDGASVDEIYIRNNIIKDCNKGIQVQGGCEIKNNNFINITASSGNDYACVVTKCEDQRVHVVGNNFENSGKCLLIEKNRELLIANNSYEGNSTFLILKNCEQGSVISNIANCSEFINCNGCNNLKISLNTIYSTGFPISTDGNNISVTDNSITKTNGGAYYTVRVKGLNNVVNNNKIEHDGSNPAIEFLSGSNYGSCSNNNIINNGSIACIRLYSNRTIIQGNKVRGGNQGIRIYGNECIINGNVTENSVYQGIHIMNGASKNIVTSNICLNNGTNLGNEGVETLLANNITS